MKYLLIDFRIRVQFPYIVIDTLIFYVFFIKIPLQK